MAGGGCSTLTPSMAKIEGQDKVVELRHKRAFDVGGRFGNVVIVSRVQTVHKGWRVVAVDGKPQEPAEVAEALMEAQKRSRYTVSFRIGDMQADEAPAAPAADGSAALADEAERLMREAAEVAAAEAAEKERQERLAAERKAAAEEEEARRREADLKAQRGAAEQRLSKKTGLPPRDEVKEPQQALLEALCKPVTPPKKKKKEGPCDKCDGPHHEEDCPHFKGKSREQHKDATEYYGANNKPGDSGDSGPYILKAARIVPQPGDGSCLFHSLAYGLKSTTAEVLRAKVAEYVSDNPDMVIGGNPLRDWVLWDAGMDVKSYAKTMRTGSRWGGAVEIAVCAAVHSVSVHVYTKGSGGFERISTFGDSADSGRAVINVHYGGRVHYDALEV